MWGFSKFCFKILISDYPRQLEKWQEIKKQFFVTDDSIELNRKPGLWKIEYQTMEDERGDFVALSPVIILDKFWITVFLEMLQHKWWNNKIKKRTEGDNISKFSQRISRSTLSKQNSVPRNQSDCLQFQNQSNGNQRITQTCSISNLYKNASEGYRVLLSLQFLKTFFSSFL